MSEPCQLLAWDTAFWGVRIGRVQGDRLDEARAAAIHEWAREHEVACLYFLSAIDDPMTARTAERHGFQFMDVRVSLRHQDPQVLTAMADAAGGDLRIRPCLPSDVDALQRIARTSYRDTRFYFDERFPRKRCDDLYALWIARSCEGYADCALVAEDAGRPMGYISCHRDAASAAGSIGLVGVSPDAQGRGIGGALVRASLAWFASEGCANVSVVTQGRNRPALRLYQRCGFFIDDMRVWYHRWACGTEG